ncbi:hypothetical protein ENUP19_0011G0022 [Entamoeba nuttalli]|uniref:Uncharacterized protein n=1 Tax=Entamoeba nuttalli TaxID=412467 RepID=A0ABQ0D837_9EUKA
MKRNCDKTVVTCRYFDLLFLNHPIMISRNVKHENVDVDDAKRYQKITLYYQ